MFYDQLVAGVGRVRFNPPSRMEGQVKAPPTLVVRSNSPVICAHEGIRNRSGKQDQSGVAVRFKEP